VTEAPWLFEESPEVDPIVSHSAIAVWNASGSPPCPYWRPDPADAACLQEVDEFGAVARKP
jgi:hypothetical protein